MEILHLGTKNMKIHRMGEGKLRTSQKCDLFLKGVWGFVLGPHYRRLVSVN